MFFFIVIANEKVTTSNVLLNAQAYLHQSSAKKPKDLIKAENINRLTFIIF